jgi:hypothetical protein
MAQVKCAKHNVPLEGPTNPESESVFSCPICGESDNLENIEREIAEYVESKMAAKINVMFGNDSDEPRPQRVYRFIIDYEP